MDLEPNDEQRLLGDSANALFSSRAQAGTRGDAPGDGARVRLDAWRAAAELGLTALAVPEAYDGVEAGPAELYVTLEALGRTVAPEPLVDAAYLPSWLLTDLGSDAQRSGWLPRIASGVALLPVAHAEPGRAWDARPAVRATGTDPVLTGTKSPVRYADDATALLVTAVDEAGALGVYLVAADAAGITLRGGRGADWSGAAAVTFDATPAERLGDGADGAAVEAALRDAFARARIALGAEAVGLMATALELTAEYLRTRKQFGVPLASFQALVHRAADMYSTLELTRSMALWATAMAEDETGEALRSAADDAFVFVADSARQAAEEAVQLHGGIGMTYEAEVSHVAARLTAITQAFGGIVAVRHRAMASDSPVTAPSALRNNAIAVA